MIYKVNLTVQATAAIELTADSPEEARRLAAELTLADIARSGAADILSLKVAAREITPLSALSGGDSGEGGDAAPTRARPSGWYRPK